MTTTHTAASNHDTLMALVKHLPTDNDSQGMDCSCNCRFFLKLRGELGYDWGVCANPNSPRAGLLTFEHMGCKNYDSKK